MFWKTAGECGNSSCCTPYESAASRSRCCGTYTVVRQISDKSLVIETLTAIQEGVNNCLSVTLETVFVRTVHRLVKSPKFISRLLYAVTYSTIAAALVTTFVKSVKPKGLADLLKIKDTSRKIIKEGLKVDPCQVFASSGGSEQLPKHISDDKMNPQTYSIEQSK